MTTTEKAKHLQGAIERLKDAIIAVESEQLPIPDFVRLYPGDARLIAEILQSLRWVNFYRYRNDIHVIGVEHQTYSECLPRPEISVADGYYETVGIIRLKDDER